MLDHTDLVLLDIKTVDDAFHKAWTGVSRDNNRRFLDHLQAIGKPVGIDIMEGKITLPLLGALASVDKETADPVRHKLSDTGSIAEHRDEIIDFVKTNGGIDYARARLQEYVDNAKIFLRALGSGKDIEMLCEIADFVGERKS